MINTAPRRARFNAAMALAFIDQGRCPCFTCQGQLVGSDWPTWRCCTDCRCHWKADVIAGKRYACTVADPRCPARCGPEEDCP